MIANAGVSVGTLTEYAEDLDTFQQVMDINVLGMVKTFQPFIAAMRTNSSPGVTPDHSAGPSKNDSQVAGYDKGRPGGVLVGIASVAGFRGLPGASAYSASKAATISYLESLRVELHDSGVKVITICPGYIKTPMTDVNTYPMPFILDAEVAAQRMARVIERGCSFAVVPWQMGVIGWLLKRLPNWLYDRLFVRAPRKLRNLP